MRVIQLSNSATLTDAEDRLTTLEEKIDYVVSDNVPETLSQFGYEKEILKNEDFYKITEGKQYTGQSLDNKSIITFRHGGIGDLIFQIPALRELKKRYPTCHITVCCGESWACIFDDLPFIDLVVSLPLKLEFLLQHDYFVTFEGVIEVPDSDGEKINAYELYAQKFYLIPESYTPELRVKPVNEMPVLNELNKGIKDVKKVVISYSASVPIRAINPEVYREVIDACPPDVKFYITGTPRQQAGLDQLISLCKTKNRVVNWSKKGFSHLRYTMALIKNCDCVISPDSGLVHIAGGFGIPVIGLFGAFPSELRMKYYKNAIGIDSMTTCWFAKGDFRSCFQHGNGSCEMAKKIGEVYSPCMSFIQPVQILNSLKILKII